MDNENEVGINQQNVPEIGNVYYIKRPDESLRKSSFKRYNQNQFQSILLK